MGSVNTLSRLQSALASAAAADSVRHDDARLSDSRTPLTHSHAETDVTNLSTDLTAKAPVASPTFTGLVTVAKFIATPIALTYAATVTTDASLGNHFRCTLTGALTLANPTNPTDGQRVTWELIQDATGSHTIAFGTAFGFGTDIPSITLSTAVNKRDFLSAIYNSTAAKWYVVAFIRGY